MHNINITNLSDHDQEFEVHGWNNNSNMTVQAHTTAVIQAEDGSSGAIIALHDGHEGEQAEITKNGFGGNNLPTSLPMVPALTTCPYQGNDFFDLSNIVGAGGNMTVQQVDKPATRKGDPRFMQNLNDAWHRTDDNTRASLDQCVHLNDAGNVARIDAIKDHPELENFIRSFADGKTYIGIGAWGGSPGNANDNNQSSAGQGNTDIQVTYNDGDASPPQVASLLAIPSHGTHKPTVTLQQAAPHHPHFAAVHRKEEAHGPGIVLTNASSQEQTYNFYDNFWNGEGTAGANFDHPTNPTTVGPGATTFVELPTSFKGRVQRGTQLPATWVEFQISASNDNAAHGDISLQQGCDGAATINATDGSGRSGGFSQDILSNAPATAVQNKPDGTNALATTMGNWMSGPNQAAIDYENQMVGQQHAYITGGTGTDDVASSNNCFAVTFY